MEGDDEYGGVFGQFADDFQPVRQDFQCETCEDDYFYRQGGVFVCSTCNTQSQQAREYLDEDLTQRAGNVRQALQTSAAPIVGPDGKRLTPAERKRTERERRRREEKTVLTNWEVYNLALKAMTEALIQMGFPELLRAKVFQIWSAYLTRRGILGSHIKSKEGQRETSQVPLSVYEPKQNLVKLLGQSWKTRKAIPKKRDFKGIQELEQAEKEITHSVSVAKRLKAITRRKAFQSQYEDEAEEDPLNIDNPDTPVLSEPGTSSSQKSNVRQVPGQGAGTSRPVFTKPARALRRIYANTRLKSLPVEFNRVKVPYSVDVFKKILRPEAFTYFHIIVVLFVSLRQLGCKVLITDLLRLVDDGTFWIDSIRNIVDVEEFAKIDSACHFALRPVYSFKNPFTLVGTTDLFIRYIGLRQFCYPTYEEFLPKFIDELALPREFECLLLEIGKMYSLELDLHELAIAKPKWKFFIEFPILCRIGMFLRMLFGFDDITEVHQSKFARTVNHVIEKLTMKNEPPEEEESVTTNSDWSKLFVIEDWFRFIRYRKQIVSSELFNGKLYIPNRPPNLTKMNDFIATYGNPKEFSVGPPTPAAKAAVKNFFSNMVDEVHGPIPNVAHYNSLQSATDSVFQTYLQWRPYVSYPEYQNEELLGMDFSKCRIDWIWNPQKYIPLLENAGYQVKIVAGDARQYKEPLLKDCLYIFQPYKSFDDYISKTNLSFSTKFLLDTLATALGPGFVAVEGGGEPSCTSEMLCTYISHFSDLYCKRAHNNVIPVLH